MINLQQVLIRPFQNQAERDTAAGLLVRSDPWKTFGRSFEQCLDAVGSPIKEAYGAFSGDRFLGVLVIDPTGPFKGYIQAACIVEEGRGCGLGTRLLRYAEERIFTFSPNCFLCYSDFNPKVGPLYERLGYKLVGVLEDYIIPGHAEFLMRKTIGPTMGFTPLAPQT